jgi:DNA-binding MarR family transcriptional regulator
MLKQTENRPIVETSPALARQLRQLVGCFYELSERLMVRQPPRASLPEVELSHAEFRLVAALGHKDSAIMSDLAGMLNVPLSTATHTVDKLVAKGLVERGRADKDRRIVLVELSEKGRRLHQSCLECQLAMGRTMLEALSPGEREIFLELMAKMTQPAPVVDRSDAI